ncbi:MAG: low molecular weight protein-tyrosine-phosphatase [Phycisphaerales bacterium]|jgi:protein-tyrosine phosphatase|nr:low molecular weight protein-tyrosine-phosphatase [Phycisphaerales bacterium]
MSEEDTIRVLFVCMGNICRSPMAEALFRHHAEAEGVMHRFEVDSAGTDDWHVGESPDARMTEVASSRNVHLSGAARQLNASDLKRFDHVLCMDSGNLRSTKRLGSGPAVVELVLSYHSDAVDLDVPDPYYGGAEGFDRVFGLLDTSCRNLMRSLLRRHDSSS